MLNPVFLVILLFVMAGAFWLLRSRKENALTVSPGAQREPVKGSAFPKHVGAILFDELKLDSQDFRQQLGVVYPELKMAFRQSVNFGVSRYVTTHWQQEPDETILNDVINRLLCDYYGFVIKKDFSADELAHALNTYFQQKKSLCKAACEFTGETRSMHVTLKNHVIFDTKTEHTNESGFVRILPDALGVLFKEESKAGYLFRQTDSEYGVVILDAKEAERLVSGSYQRVLSPAGIA